MSSLIYCLIEAAQRWPEFFPGASIIGNYVQDLASAYIGGFVFWVIAEHWEQQRTKSSTMFLAVSAAHALVRWCDEFIKTSEDGLELLDLDVTNRLYRKLKALSRRCERFDTYAMEDLLVRIDMTQEYLAELIDEHDHFTAHHVEFTKYVQEIQYEVTILRSLASIWQNQSESARSCG